MTSSITRTLTVWSIESDRLDVTAVGGPSRIITGGRITVSYSDGEFDLKRRITSGPHPQIGDTAEFTFDPKDPR